MGCDEHPDPRWARPGPHRVVTSEAAEPIVMVRREPETAGPHPVVVLCHGLGGSHRGYAALGHHLASHGYTVLHPQFLDAFELAAPQLGLTELSGVDEHTWAANPVAREKLHKLLLDPRHWRSRADRVHAVLEALGPRSSGVIVAGHSFGAYTAQLLLGTRLSGPDRDFSHPNVAGGILLSPQGSGDRGLTETSWAGVNRPLLVVTGTRDFGARGEGVEWRREPFDRAPARLKHLAVVRGGTHQLGGIPGHERDAGPVAAGICALATAFADRVHGARTAGEWLANGPFPAIFEHTHHEEVACPTS